MKKNIKLFVHCVDVTQEARQVLEEQVNLLEETGLFESAYEIHMLLHYNENSFDWIKERWKGHDKVKWIFNPSIIQKDYELGSIVYIQEYCHAAQDDFYLLYMHQKGVWNISEGNSNWRYYMHYWFLEKWKDCVDKLDEGYELVGAGYKDWFPHDVHRYFAGNFYWSQKDYIKRCKRLKLPSEVNYEAQFDNSAQNRYIEGEYRYDAETWNGSGDPLFYDFHPGDHGRWYRKPITYRNDLKGI